MNEVDWEQLIDIELIFFIVAVLVVSFIQTKKVKLMMNVISYKL